MSFLLFSNDIAVPSEEYIVNGLIAFGKNYISKGIESGKMEYFLRDEIKMLLLNVQYRYLSIQCKICFKSLVIASVIKPQKYFSDVEICMLYEETMGIRHTEQGFKYKNHTITGILIYKKRVYPNWLFRVR